MKEYELMWNDLKEYLEEYNSESEIHYIVQQIEERYFKHNDIIEDLLNEISK